MTDTFSCPNCTTENAYFNGVVFVCPDCDFKWSNNKVLPNTNITRERTEYDEAIKLDKPYFTLKHGKLYECKVLHNQRTEEITIVPLAFEKNKNRQYIMIDARRLYKQYPQIVHDIVKMDFNRIWNDGLSHYPFDFSSSTILCATVNNRTVIDYNDFIYYDFIETNEIDSVN